MGLVQVTYREISERFGIGIEGARLKAKRRAAKHEWRIIPGNHPQDVVRVEMPAEDFRAAPHKVPRVPPHSVSEGSPTLPPQQDEQRGDNKNLEALVEVVTQLTTHSQALTERLIEAERRRAQAESDAVVVRAEMEGLKREVDVLTQAHLAELKALRERLEGDRACAHAELEAWKTRPWWRRLIG